MPFKFKWPFGWFSRKRTDADAAEATPAETPAPEATPLAPSAPEAPVWSAVRPTPEPERPFVYTPEPGEGPDLGTELLTRLPQLSTPPTLGQLGGLPAMAQTLPAVDRFMQQMPAPPVQRLLEGAWSEITQFTTELPALSSLGGVPEADAPPSFPEQLAPSQAAAGLTDVLPPLGSLPGQIPAVSGEAPVLMPEPPQPTAPVVQVVTVPGPAATAPEMPVLRAVQPPAAPGAPTTQAAQPTQPAAPAVVQPLLTPVPREPVAPLGLAGMIQLVSIESTLAGNVLPASEVYPVLRELIPYTPVWRQSEPEPPAAGPAAPAPSDERITPVQRAAIESQRGQGQPLAPAIRQQFEGAYGASLNAVRVHTGQAAHETAQSLNAIAFASGPDLFFAHNAFQPQSEQGLGLLGHELAHVVQQQLGVAGDPDALRPADDHYERRADQMAAAALDTPLAAPSTPPSAAPVQRALVGQFTPTVSAVDEPAFGSPRATLDRTEATSDSIRPLATISALSSDVADQVVQRFSLSNIGNMARNLPAQAAALPSNLPSELPALNNAASRVSDMTSQLPSRGSLASNASSLTDNRPALNDLGGLAQNGPALPSGLPALNNLPSSLGGLTEQLPALPGGLGQNLPGGMPALGGMAQSLGGGLPAMPSLSDRPGGGALPSLEGLQPPEMPLAEGLGGAASAAGGALAAGQEALGTITSMAPAMPEMPSTPPLPSLEKITDHVWKQVQQRLKVERERSRGLA